MTSQARSEGLMSSVLLFGLCQVIVAREVVSPGNNSRTLSSENDSGEVPIHVHYVHKLSHPGIKYMSHTCRAHIVC